MDLFRPIRLREFEGRMLSGLLLLLCGFIPILGGAFYVLHDLVRDEREFVELRTHQTILTERLNTSFERQLSLVPVFVLTGRDEVLDELQASRANMRKVLSELEGFANEADEKEALAGIRDSEEKMHQLEQEGVRRRQNGASTAEVNNYFRREAGEVTLDLQDKLAKFTRRQAAELDQSRENLKATANEAVFGLALVSTLTLLFIGGVTLLLVRELRRKRRADRETLEALRREREISLHRKENVDIVSHDLKNPIAALKLRMQLLARREGSDSIEHDLRLALQSVNSMETLVRDLLDHAKIDSGRLPISRQACRAEELIQAAIARVEPLAQDKGVRLTSYVEPGFPSVDCDPARISQVLDNLVGNALKFTPKGGNVRVSASFQARQWMISVADTGSGIPAEHLPHVFERFWQDSKTAAKGNGLGLAIAKGIVEAHGGRIWAESRAGQGAEFFFTLPLEARLSPESAAPTV